MIEHECWWKFPGCSKIDVLEENKHPKQIICALRDPCTQISISNGRYVLYDEDQALLVVPHRFSLQMILFLYKTFLAIATQ